MIIPNHKTVYKNVSDKYNLNYDLVEKIGSFTWSDLNRRVSEFENREIYMLKLGTWKLRKIKGEHILKFLRQNIYNIRNSNEYTEEEKKINIELTSEKIKKLSILLKEWDDILEEQKQFKIGNSNRNISEQK